jgi:hypothetical protein
MKHTSYGFTEDDETAVLEPLSLDEMIEKFCRQCGWNANSTLLLVAAIRENTEALRQVAENTRKPSFKGMPG